MNVTATDWFPVGAKWYWSNWCINYPPFCSYYTVEITKDTLIQSKLFKKGEYTLYDESNPNGNKILDATILFEENNGKINYLFRDSLYRMYDFNLNVGDTMYTDMTALCNNFITDLMPIKDTVLIAKSKVDSVQTIINNSIPLKRIFLHALQDTTSSNYVKGVITEPGSPFSIVEKVGVFDHIGFFGQVTDGPILTGGYYGKLRCYSDTGIYFNQINNVRCDTLNHLVNENYLNQNNTVTIFPNPAKNMIHVGLINKYVTSNIIISIAILTDALGNEIKKINSVQLQNFELNISDLPNGIYFIRIVINKESLIKSFIINH
jgi:hypothetical protein